MHQLLWITAFILLPALVLSQDLYTCPQSKGFGLCVVTPKSCWNDSNCHIPGERCCAEGCGRSCKPVVQGLCPYGEPAKSENGENLFCGRGPNHVDCPTNTVCRIDPLDTFAVCCPNITMTLCEANLCGRDELCYLEQVYCIRAPCPPFPICYPHPCKNACRPGQSCHLESPCPTPGYCRTRAVCEGKGKGKGIKGRASRKSIDDFYMWLEKKYLAEPKSSFE